ncbi:MAG: outer membrane beta-barrel protein [Hyphomicrobiaceae bacterium]
MPSGIRGTNSASDGLFGGPVDPDTQDSPDLNHPSNGEGSRIGLPQDGGIPLGRRAGEGPNDGLLGISGGRRRSGRSGRVLQPGDPDYGTAQVVDGDLRDEGRFFEPRPEGDDIDADLRADYDDDLRLEPLVAEDVLTGPTVGARDLLTRRDDLLDPTGDGFSVRPRQAYAEDDDRPYEPLGLRAGSFRVLPTLSATSIVTDNVFNAAGIAEADIGTELRPTLRIESDWSRHSLSVDANGSAVYYDEFHSEDSVEFAAVVQSRLDMTLRTNLEFDAGYQLETEGRGSANVASGAIEQPDVETLQAGVTFNHRFNRLLARARFGYTEEMNGDARLSDGTVDSGADEDFVQYDYAARLTYEFSPSFAAFVEGAYNQQRFDVAADVDGVLRSSDGYEMRLGVTTELGPAILAEVSAGYVVQTPDAAQLSEVDGFVLDADVIWRPSALTTVSLTAQSDVNTSDLAGSVGSLQYQAALNIRHEFRRYLAGILGFGWRTQDFQGSNVTEDELSARIGGEYFFSRSLAAIALYEFTDFSSSQPDSDYQTNEFRIGLQVRR